MSFDEILEEIGGCGRYQLLTLFLMNLVKGFAGFATLLPVIVAYEQIHNCSVNYNTSNVPGNGSVILGKCDMYRDETPNIRTFCSKWTYDDSIMRSTIVSQFNLVCGREYLVSLTTTLFFIGFTIGCTAYGILSDRFGRLIGVIASTIHLFIFSLLAVFAPNIWVFGILRLLVGIGNGGVMTTSFTMSAEITDPKHRALFSIMSQNGFTVAALIMALLGYFIANHIWIQLIIALSMVLGAIVPIFIHESPRWLLTTGRIQKAERVIRAIAQTNGRPLREDFDINVYVSDKCDNIGKKLEDTSSADLKENFKALFRNWPLTWTTIIVWYYWLAISMAYFGSYFTLGKIGANIFIDLAVNSTAEIFSRIFDVYIAKWWGRILSLTVCATLGGLMCIINAIIVEFDSLITMVRIISAIGQFFLTGGFDMVWFYSGEVFPTVIRNVGVGIGSTWARIGGTMAPQVALLFPVWKPLPLMIMGILSLVAGISSLILPETKDRDLAETMVDGRELVESEFGIAKTFHKNRRHELRQENQNTDTE